MVYTIVTARDLKIKYYKKKRGFIMKQLNKIMLQLLQETKQTFTRKTVISILLGTAITSFGIYNVHRQTGITEGGILGLLLLCNYWFGISSSLLSPVLDGISYLFGFKFLGRDFLKTSIFATFSLAAFFRLWEMFPPLLPSLAGTPLLAAVIGGLFIGVGCGLVVRQGASCGGDDALALIISKTTRLKISQAYLFTDITVLSLSLSYIPVRRIVYSLVTVTISSYLIDIVTTFGRDKDEKPNSEAVPE